LLRALLDYPAEGETITEEIVNLLMRIRKEHMEFQSVPDREIGYITCSAPAGGCSGLDPSKHETLFVLEPHVQCETHGQQYNSEWQTDSYRCGL